MLQVDLSAGYSNTVTNTSSCNQDPPSRVCTLQYRRVCSHREPKSADYSSDPLHQIPPSDLTTLHNIAGVLARQNLSADTSSTPRCEII
jgi:hypothetical protein